MTHLELWARIESQQRSDYTSAVYDVDTDRVWWYENEADARSHFRSGNPIEPVSTVGLRAATSRESA